MDIYRERAHLVALLAAVYPSGWTRDPAEPDWPVITIQTPRGQMCWHISPSDLDLFDRVVSPTTPLTWDGHTTEEKYERMRQLTRDHWDRD